MFGSVRRELRETLDAIQTRLERIDVALIVRDPGSARSAEVFEGLRRSVVSAARSRRQHLSQLIKLTEVLEQGATPETLSALVDQWRMEVGLRRWDEPAPSEFFEVIEGEGRRLEVQQPAWVDTGAGDEVVLVKPGLARRIAAAPTGSEDELEVAGEAERSINEAPLSEVGHVAEMDGADGRRAGAGSADAADPGTADEVREGHGR